LRQDVNQIDTSIQLDKNSGAITVTPKAVPEPTSILGLLALGAMGAGSILKKKQA
jgi:PEP-CTERM motif